MFFEKTIEKLSRSLDESEKNTVSSNIMRFIKRMCILSFFLSGINFFFLIVFLSGMFNFSNYSVYIYLGLFGFLAFLSFIMGQIVTIHFLEVHLKRKLSEEKANLENIKSRLLDQKKKLK